MGALAADLVGVGAGGLVAVVAVGDQQLRLGELGRRRRAWASGSAIAPDPVHGPVVVGDLGPGLAAGGALDVLPGVAGVQGEDRGEVVAGRPGQPQPVLLGAGLGALVGADQAGAVVGHPHPAEQAAPRAARARRAPV